MRNLELDILKVHDLPIKSEIVKKIVDTNEDTYILDGQILRRGDSSEVIHDSITSLEFIKDENLLYAGDGNNFHWINVADGESGVIEIPDGYIAYKWNPSQDKIAVVDKNGYFSMFVLCPHRPPFAIVQKYKLSIDERTNFIDIGWGSKSTQFHGSAGKKSRSHNIYGCDEIIVDDQSVSIAWREDNEYLAISFIRDGKRTIKMFNHEGQYCFESDDRPGLCPQMTWRPNGSLLAVVQRQNKDHQSIFFFEKNGLYKSRISLPSNNEVKHIEWNDKMLMLWHHDPDITHEISDEIYIWTWTNYRWYRKQCLIFKREDQVNYVAWHDKVWLKVITAKKLLRYRWKWVTHRSMHDLGAILVIDGNDLNVTTLNNQILPPPMYTYCQSFTKQINFVAVDLTSNYLVVVLCDNTFILTMLTDTSMCFESCYRNAMEYKIPLATNHFVYDHSINSLFYVESLDRSKSQLNKYRFDTNLISSNLLDSSNEITDFFSTIQKHCLAVCRESKLFLYESIESPKLVKIGQYNISEINIKCGGSNVTGTFRNETFYVFALINKTLFINGIQVINNLTSYLVFKNLLAITVEDKMFLCTIEEHSINLLKRHEWHLLNYRLIPNGALLVHGNPDTMKIVLQVPRGELEVLSPRMLSVCKIESLLADKKYLDAYKIMHQDRINTNILYDIDPNAFYTNLNDIVKSINNCDYLDIFITQLSDKNVTEELYRSCFETRLPIWTYEKNVGNILNQMVDVMLKIDKNYYLQSIITAFITMGTDDAYELALLELLAAKEREETGVEMHKPVESVLKHAIIISSVETLYKIALGMYNQDLIMWIAANSKLDPAEYIPFLKDLFILDDPNYRNYKINCHIKRYEKALECLIQCNDVFDELDEFITNYSLQKSILRHTTNRNNKYYAVLTKTYCDYLESVGDHYQAGLLYLEVEDYHQAIECFIKSSKMDEVVATIALLEYEKHTSFITDIYERLAQQLLNHKHYSDASTIYCNYLFKKEDAISALTQGKLWIEAKMLSLELKLNQQIDRKIKPELMKCTHELIHRIKSSEDEFNHLKRRLNVIRQEKLAQLCANNNMTNGVSNIKQGITNLNFDLESIASTTQSQQTGTTNMTSNTSRRRKRIERKIMQIREGSGFENVAIIRKLHILMTDMLNLADTLQYTCRSLLFVNSDYSLAKQLQTNYESVINHMFSSSSEIWPDQMLNPPNPYNNDTLIFLHNVEHLDFEYRFPPADKRHKWMKLSI